jgi:hypothetical protein
MLNQVISLTPLLGPLVAAVVAVFGWLGMEITTKAGLAALFTVVTATASAQDLPIDSPVLQGTPSYELGAVVLALMPPLGVQPAWGWSGGLPVKWRAKHVIDASNPNGIIMGSRDGQLRVNVLGDVITAQNPRREIGWSVSLVSGTDAQVRESARLGPDTIGLSPANDECEGRGTQGCGFDPMLSLMRAGIDAKFLCKQHRPGNSIDSYYLLSSSGKAPVVVDWYLYPDSGGLVSMVLLRLRQAPADVCS